MPLNGALGRIRGDQKRCALDLCSVLHRSNQRHVTTYVQLVGHSRSEVRTTQDEYIATQNEDYTSKPSGLCTEFESNRIKHQILIQNVQKYCRLLFFQTQLKFEKSGYYWSIYRVLFRAVLYLFVQFVYTYIPYFFYLDHSKSVFVLSFSRHVCTCSLDCMKTNIPRPNQRCRSIR